MWNYGRVLSMVIPHFSVAILDIPLLMHFAWTIFLSHRIPYYFPLLRIFLLIFPLVSWLRRAIFMFG
jgi:hypothetical protein